MGYGEETTKKYSVDPKVKGMNVKIILCYCLCCNYNVMYFSAVEGTRRDNTTIPAITVVAIVAGLALIVLVVLVAIIIWRKMRRNGKLNM